jgi:tetratricopeptide (TPR) repeat protein
MKRYLFLLLFIFSSNTYSFNIDTNELIYVINYYIQSGDKAVSDFYDDYYKAAELSRELIKLNPESDIGYAYLAYSLGNILRELPFYKKISASKEIYSSAVKALQLNKNNHLALYTIGIVYREAVGLDGFERAVVSGYFKELLSEASLEKAIYYLEKACELQQDDLQYKYELAKTYSIFDKDKSINIYKQILEKKAVSEKDKLFQKKAISKLKKLNNMAIK